MEGGGSSQDWGGSASSNRYGNLDARSAFQNTQFPAQQPAPMPAQNSGFGGNPSFDPWQAQSPGATFNNWSNNFSQPSATQMPSIPSASSSFQSPMTPQMQQMPGNSEISQPPSPMPSSASVSSYFQPTQTMFPFYQAAMQQQAAPSAPAPAPISAPVAAPPSPAPAQNFTLDQINQVAGVPATPAAPPPMATPVAPAAPPRPVTITSFMGGPSNNPPGGRDLFNSYFNPMVVLSDGRVVPNDKVREFVMGKGVRLIPGAVGSGYDVTGI